MPCSMPKPTGFCTDFRGGESGGFLRTTMPLRRRGFCIGTVMPGNSESLRGWIDPIWTGAARPDAASFASFKVDWAISE